MLSTMTDAPATAAIPLQGLLDLQRAGKQLEEPPRHRRWPH